MSRKSNNETSVNTLKEKLEKLDPSTAQKNKPMNVMRELMPLITEKQQQGFSLREIYEVVGVDLGIKEQTFKTYYRQLKAERPGNDDHDNPGIS